MRISVLSIILISILTIFSCKERNEKKEVKKVVETKTARYCQNRYPSFMFSCIKDYWK